MKNKRVIKACLIPNTRHLLLSIWIFSNANAAFGQRQLFGGVIGITCQPIEGYIRKILAQS